MFNRSALASVSRALVTATAAAQQPVPVAPGVVGTIGLDGTIDKFYHTTHSVLVKSADGAHHLVGVTDKTVVHGAESEDPLHGLSEGRHVVVHYVVKGSKKTAVEIDHVGDAGLHVVQGVVVGVDRPARKLIVELPDDKWVTLRLTDRAAHDVGKEVATRSRVVVYYADEGGAQVAHYFKKVE